MVKQEFENKYALYYEDGEEKLSKKQIKENKKAVAAEKAVDKAVEKFYQNMKKISRKYKGVGLGDTMTDEIIAQEVYSMIHSL